MKKLIILLAATITTIVAPSLSSADTFIIVDGYYPVNVNIRLGHHYTRRCVCHCDRYYNSNAWRREQYVAQQVIISGGEW